MKKTDVLLHNKIQKLKMVIVDIDGVMTNGEIIYSENGDELKIFDVHDGFQKNEKNCAAKAAY